MSQWASIIGRFSSLPMGDSIDVLSDGSTNFRSKLYGSLQQSSKTKLFKVSVAKISENNFRVIKIGEWLTCQDTPTTLTTRLLDSPLNFTHIARCAGITRERVRQIAKRLGHTGKTRHAERKILTEHSRHIIGRPPCSRCGSQRATKRGFGKLGRQRFLCGCGHVFESGQPRRAPVVRDFDFYSRIGKMGSGTRWGFDEPLRLNYPYIASSSMPSDGSDLIAKVNSLVSKHLPEDIRADVCQEILLRIVSGDLQADELSRDIVRPFVTERYRQNPWGDISLSEPRFDGDKTFGEVIGVY